MNGERTGKNEREICKCCEDASIGKYLIKYGRYYVSANLFYHRQLHERLRAMGFKVISIQKLATHPVWELRLKADDYRLGFLRPFGLIEPKLKTQVRLILKHLGQATKGAEIDVMRSGDYLQVAFLSQMGRPGVWRPQSSQTAPIRVSLILRRWLRAKRN